MSPDDPAGFLFSEERKAMENQTFDIICIGMALVDSIIKGFDPQPISASGYRAVSGSLNVGGEAVNEAVAASKLGMKTAILCALGNDDAGDNPGCGIILTAHEVIVSQWLKKGNRR